jgi:hypothetical protein
MKKLILTICLVLSGAAHATEVVYTIGEPQSSLLTKTFLPDRTVMAMPGAEGLLAWQSFLKDSNGVTIQPPQTVHISPGMEGRKDYSAEADLIAIMAVTQLTLITRPDTSIRKIEDLNKKQYSIATTSENGVCSRILRKLRQEIGIDFLLVPFKTASQGKIALLGGHVDMHCVPGAIAQDYVSSGQGVVVANLSKQFGFPIRYYVFVNKNMSNEQRTKIINNLKRPINNDEKSLMAQSGINLDSYFGEDAKAIFLKERILFQKLLNF